MDHVSLPGQKAFLRVTKVPGHLTDPKAVRLPGDSTDLHPSTRQVDEEEHQESGQPLARPGLDSKEVRSHDLSSVSGQEFLPRGLPPTLRRRFQTVFLQKVGNRWPCGPRAVGSPLGCANDLR